MARELLTTYVEMERIASNQMKIPMQKQLLKRAQKRTIEKGTKGRDIRNTIGDNDNATTNTAGVLCVVFPSRQSHICRKFKEVHNPL